MLAAPRATRDAFALQAQRHTWGARRRQDSSADLPPRPGQQGLLLIGGGSPSVTTAIIMTTHITRGAPKQYRKAQDLVLR